MVPVSGKTTGQNPSEIVITALLLNAHLSYFADCAFKPTLQQAGLNGQLRFLGHLSYHELALLSVRRKSTYDSELFKLTVSLGRIWNISSGMG